MYAAVILIQILAVSVGGYVNFVLEGPCPEKYYGSPNTPNLSILLLGLRKR